MKTRTFLFALCAISLCACGTPSVGPSTSSSDASSSRANPSIITHTGVSKDLAIGSSTSLEKYYTVINCPDWYAEALTDNVIVDGHNVVALEYGPYRVRLHAGNLTRNLTGAVVSSEKVAFNELFLEVYDNFTAFWTLGSGENIQMGNYVVRAPGYVATYYGYDYTAGSYLFRGTIDHPSNGDHYSFEVKGDIAPTGDRYALGKTIEVLPGYSKSIEHQGFEPVSLDPDKIEELYTEAGYPQRLYYLDDADEISLLFDNLLGGGWYYLQTNYKAEGLLFTTISTGIRLVPVASNGAIIDSEIDIMAIGESWIQGCEAWLEDPVAPEKLDVSPIQTFFDKVLASKSYTITGTGEWLIIYSDGSTTAIDCPADFHFSDTGTEILSNFRTVGYHTPTASLSRIIDISDNATNFIHLDEKILPGETEVYFNHNDALYHAKGNYDIGEDEYAFEDDPERMSEATYGRDVWGLLESPAMFSSELGLLSDASFYDSLATGGQTYYYLNDCGKDVERYPDYHGTLGCAYRLVGNNLGSFALVVPQSSEWFDFATCLFNINDSGTELTFMVTIGFTNSRYYRFSWTIRSVGSTNFPDGLLEELIKRI